MNINMRMNMNRYDLAVKDIHIRRRPIIISVDSSVMSDKTDYTVEFPSGPIRDVLGIELVKAVAPNPDNVNYLALKIVGMDNVQGNTSTLSDCFCTLERTATDSSPIVYQRNGDYHNMAYTYCFTGPSRLDRLHIKWYLPDGGAPDFGSGDHLLVFEVHAMNRPELPTW